MRGVGHAAERLPELLSKRDSDEWWNDAETYEGVDEREIEGLHQHLLSLCTRSVYFLCGQVPSVPFPEPGRGRNRAREKGRESARACTRTRAAFGTLDMCARRTTREWEAHVQSQIVKMAIPLLADAWPLCMCETVGR